MSYELLIDGNDLSPPAADLVSLRVGYNIPRELVIAVEDAADAPLNKPVILVVDGVVRFRGTVVRSESDPQLGQRHRVACHDLSERSDAVQILAWKYTLAVGALWSMFYGRYSVDLSELLDEIDAAARDDLQAHGVIGTGSAPVFAGYSDGVVPYMELYPATFRELLDRVTEPLAGVRWLWVPAASTGDSGGVFRIVNVFTAPEQTLSVPGAPATGMVQALGLSRSIEGCYSHVWIEPILYTSEGQGSVVLTPAWNSALEATWSLAVAEPGTAYADVYRKYSYSAAQHDSLLEDGMKLTQIVERWPGDASPIEVPIEIDQVDHENQILWTKNPAVAYYAYRRTAATGAAPGQAKPAGAVKLSYVYLDEHIATHAEAGPDGTAYHKYGLERTLRMEVDSVQDVTVPRAQEILDLVKDERISGTLPVSGPVPSWLWDLGARLNISGVGAELINLKAIVSGFQHDFGGGGVTHVELTTDKSKFATVQGL